MKNTNRIVISRSNGKRKMIDGSLSKTEQVVYKYPTGKVKGKMKYKSLTKHERVN